LITLLYKSESPKQTHPVLQHIGLISHVICSVRSLLTKQNSCRSLQLRSPSFLEHGNTVSIPVRCFCTSFYMRYIGVTQQIEPTCRNTTEYLLISISLPFISVHLPFNVHCTYTELVGRNIRRFYFYSFGRDVILRLYVVLLSTSTQLSKYYPKLCHNRFLPYTYNSLFGNHPVVRLYFPILCDTDSRHTL